MPTLEDGNKLIVNKMSYQIGELHRFDVIVFHHNKEEDYVKRIIGLPGDKIEYRNDVLYINGEKVRIRTPTDAVRYGIGYLSEDRKRFGCILGMRLADNAVLPSLANYVKGLFLNEKKISRDAAEYVDKVDIRTPSVDQLLKNLSGGNQQKVIVAKWLIRNCDILIFDEPTRGIDVGAKSEIYKLMNALVSEGKSIIMISSELNEIFRMSDRILVMSSGMQTATLPIEETDQHTVMRYAVQHSTLITAET